jgi:hypothetical protein
VLLSAPGRGWRAKASPFQVYILIEHQSEPDPQMVYRALRYVVQIHDRQQQAWLQQHSNTRPLLFDPVLPIVVYAGTKRWQRLLPIREVVRHANLFGSMIPKIAPRFVNVRETAPEVLRTQVGVIGWVLWLIQQQQQPLAEFEEILRQVVAAVNPLAAREQSRGIRLLWFATYLVYHERPRPEWDRLIAIILASVREEFREEVASMGQSIFDELRAEGRSIGIAEGKAQGLAEGKAEGKIEGKIEGILEGKRAALLRLLRLRFKRVPREIRAEIEAMLDSEKLDEWFDAVVIADRITDVPFQANLKT